MSGGVGEAGPLVSTSFPSQSTAAVADAPAAPGGNFSPAFKANVSALFALSVQLFRHSSNMSATPGTLGRYPPISLPPTDTPPLGLLK